LRRGGLRETARLTAVAGIVHPEDYGACVALSSPEVAATVRKSSTAAATLDY